MGLFDNEFKSYTTSGLFFPFKYNGPSLVEKIEMIFKDVETEGKKQGYDKAAKEYGKVFRALEQEYEELKKFIEEQRNNYDLKSEGLILRLEILEREKVELEKEVQEKIKEVSSKYKVPTQDVSQSLTSGALFIAGPLGIDFLNVIYNQKELQFRMAELQGYVEARKLYEEKIQRLKKDMISLKEKGNREIKEMVELINNIMVDIINEQMKIAELKVLL